MGRKKTGVSRFNAQNTTPGDEGDLWQASLPRDGKPKLAGITQDGRARVFADWKAFMTYKHPEVDCDQVWENIIRDDHASKAFVLEFIDNYIKHSGRPARHWRSTEGLPKQKAVTCVSTANGVMKRLIAAAEAEIIRPLRKRDPDKAWMRLARPQGTDGARDDGPLRDITRWIATSLKEKWGLTIDSEYNKAGATAEDLRRMLQMLWERADHIPMPPQNRVMFHMYLVILFLPGSRPGMVPGLRWKDIQLWLEGNKSYPRDRRLKANITLFRNKKRREALLVGSDEDRFEFTVSLMPTALFCVTHLLVARAWQQGAFQTPYKSVEDIIYQPGIGPSGVTPLQWKKEMLETPVITISYATFLSYWHRLCIVSGFAIVPRPYAFRVGSGEAINKHTTSTTRNHILGHSERTFQKKYQSRNVRVDLQKIHFGELAGITEDTPLCAISRHYDPYAPIYITQENKDEIDQSDCVKEMRKQVDSLKEQGADVSEIKEAEGILGYWQSRFRDKALLERRMKYFQRTAQLREENNEAGLRDLQEDPYQYYVGSKQHSRLDIDRLMNLWAPGTIFDEGAQARSLKAMQWLVYYMDGSFEAISRHSGDPCPSTSASISKRDKEEKSHDSQIRARHRPGKSEEIPIGKDINLHQEVDSTEDGPKIPTQPSVMPDGRLIVKPTCLVCRTSFERRSELTRHSKSHMATLSAPFHCPECRRQGLAPPPTQKPSEWSNHVERFHGKQHAPNFADALIITTGPKAIAKFSCAICHKQVSIHEFPRHINKDHVSGILTDKRVSVDCPVCPSMGNLSIDTYISHVSIHHGVQPLERCPFCRQFFTRRGVVTHIQSHFRQLSSPIPCPLCEQLSQAAECFEDYLSWRIHAIRTSDHLLEDSALAPVYSPDTVLGTKRKLGKEPPSSSMFRVSPPKRIRQEGGKVT